jgi:hypothetical protein
MLRSFRSEGNDVKFLKRVYGSDSIVYKKAKMAADAQAEEVKKSISKDLLYLSEVEPPASDGAQKSTLLEAENAYWDAANMVLMDTKAWVHLSSSMERFKYTYALSSPLLSSPLLSCLVSFYTALRRKKKSRHERSKNSFGKKWFTSSDGSEAFGRLTVRTCARFATKRCSPRQPPLRSSPS